MRKVVCLILMIAILLSVSVNIVAAKKVQLYAPGKSAWFDEEDVEAQLGVGWYREPLTLMYAKDGRKKYVLNSEIEKFKKLNWYLEPPTQILYAPGKSKEFKTWEVEAQLKVGWYTEPVTLMYAKDGRTRYVVESEVEKFKELNWFTEVPMQTLYAPGKSKAFKAWEVEAQLKVGWYLEPVTQMYALDGRSKWVEKSEVNDYKQVGWYSGVPTWMYAVDGRKKIVGADDVAANEEVGWFSSQPTKVYAADGRSKYIAHKDIAKNINVGWYPYKIHRTSSRVTTLANPVIYNHDGIKVIYTGTYFYHNQYESKTVRVDMQIINETGRELSTSIWPLKLNGSSPYNHRFSDAIKNGNITYLSIYITPSSINNIEKTDINVAPNATIHREVNTFDSITDVETILFNMELSSSYTRYGWEKISINDIQIFVPFTEGLALENDCVYNGYPIAMYCDDYIIFVGSNEVEAFETAGWSTTPQ